MTSRRLLTSTFTALAILAPVGVALAAPASTVEAAPALPSPYQVSVSASLLPVGRVRTGTSGEASEYPSTTAYGFVPAIDRRISRHLTIGLALPVQFNVSSVRATSEPATTEIDALVRLAAWFPVADRVRLFAYAAPGYYVMMVPSEVWMSSSRPKGVVVATGGGATYALSERWFLSGDVGAQASVWPPTTGSGLNAPQGSAFLRMSLGAGVAF